MPDVTFTNEDLLRSTKLVAGWYKLKIVNHTEKPTKDGTSMNDWIDFVTEGGKAPGVPIKMCFNEQVPPVDFINALTRGKIEVGKSYSFSQAVGQYIEGYCRFDPMRKWNTIEDFRPVQAGA